MNGARVVILEPSILLFLFISFHDFIVSRQKIHQVGLHCNYQLIQLLLSGRRKVKGHTQLAL